MINLLTKQKKYRGYDIIINFYGPSEPPSLEGWFYGYVRLPDGHAFYEQDNDKIKDYINVHGGVTFVGGLTGYDGLFIGFYCGHEGDDPRVQNEEYTTRECERMIDQLIELENLEVDKTGSGKGGVVDDE